MRESLEALLSLANNKLQRLEPVHVVLNKTSGSKEGEGLYLKSIKPFLDTSNIKYTLHQDAPTQATASAWQFPPNATILLIGGDGTLSDLFHAILKPSSDSLPSYKLILFPSGTANAYYHFLFPPSEIMPEENPFLSLASAINKDQGRPLSLARIQSQTIDRIAHVVVSSCFHASILHEAELLRDQVEGIERFKVAAAKCWNKLYSGLLTLENVQTSHPGTDDFKGPKEQRKQIQSRDWMYMNVMLTDRLEKELVVAPFRKLESRGLDVVAIRRPEFISEEVFWSQMQIVFAAVYQNGKHVNLVWTEEGKVVEGSKGVSVVDYFRCDALEWTPHFDSATAAEDRLICMDGALAELEGPVRIDRLPNETLRVFA